MTLIVGVHPAKDDRSVLELAATLARSAGQDLFVIAVVPTPWSGALGSGTDHAFEAWSDELGQRAVERIEKALAESFPDVQASAAWVAGSSVPGTLIEQAEATEARMIVVGSGSAGPYGHIHVNSTAETLLHSSPVAVAVATRGYRSGEVRRIARVTLAFRGDETSRFLGCAAELCAEVHASLRLVTFAVRPRTMHAPQLASRPDDDVASTWVQRAEAALKEALTTLDTAPDDVECVVAEGATWPAAVDSLSWRADDVLVVGSSQNRGRSRVFLGSTATKIARNSPVPVIVVP